MELTVDKIGKVTVVELPGDNLDASNTRVFRGEVSPLLEGNTKLVFDMAKVQFLDSSGLGTLLSCLRQVNAKGGDLKLCCLTDQVRVIFELVRMHRVFEIFNTREEAVETFA